MTSPQKRTTLVRVVLLIVVAGVSLAAWFVPSMLGAPSRYDSLFVAAWLVLMAILLIDSRRRDRKRRRYARTFYVDEESSRVFGPMLGTVPYANGCELFDAIAVALANEGTAPACLAPPEDFVPTYVVETAEFSCVRDARLKAAEPAACANDVTVVRWTGCIVDLATGHKKEFASPFDLEDAFCPSYAVSAAADGASLGIPHAPAQQGDA